MAIYAEARLLFEHTADLEGIADSDLGQGRIYYSLGSLDKASACFKEAWANFEVLGIKERIADCMWHHGHIYLS